MSRTSTPLFKVRVNRLPVSEAARGTTVNK